LHRAGSVGIFQFRFISVRFSISSTRFPFFSVSVFARHHDATVSWCVKILRRSQLYFDGSFCHSTLANHTECEGVFLHPRCDQLLHTRGGRSVCRSVTIRKNLKAHDSDCEPYLLA